MEQLKQQWVKSVRVREHILCAVLGKGHDRACWRGPCFPPRLLHGGRSSMSGMLSWGFVCSRTPLSPLPGCKHPSSKHCCTIKEAAPQGCGHSSYTRMRPICLDRLSTSKRGKSWQPYGGGGGRVGARGNMWCHMLDQQGVGVDIVSG